MYLLPVDTVPRHPSDSVPDSHAVMFVSDDSDILTHPPQHQQQQPVVIPTIQPDGDLSTDSDTHDSHDMNETYYDAQENPEGEGEPDIARSSYIDFGRKRSSFSSDLFTMSPLTSPILAAMPTAPTPIRISTPLAQPSDSIPFSSASPSFFPASFSSSPPMGSDHLPSDQESYSITFPSPSTSIEGNSLPIDIKGKGRLFTHEPPILPPLSFSPNSHFSDSFTSSQGGFDWGSYERSLNQAQSGASTSSSPPIVMFGFVEQSICPSTPTNVSTSSPTAPPPAVTVPLLSRTPSRAHSFSHVSVHSSRSIAFRSMSAIRGKINRSSLFRRKRPSLEDDLPDTIKPDKHHRPKLPWLSSKSLPSERAPQPLSLKGKGRTWSTPLLLNVEDVIPSPPPAPPIRTFEGSLPRELKLLVFCALIVLHEEEHEKRVSAGKWSVAAAKRERWVHREAGMRELIKFSRVSKSWQKLTLDGQLWSDFDLHAFPNISSTLLLRIVGPFVRNLILRGHNHLTTSTLLSASSAMFIPQPAPDTGIDGHFWRNQLTTLDLQGCTSITTRALHHILILSPGLRTVRLRGLGCVTNSTCDVLGTHCPQIKVLDLGRCSSMDTIGAMAFLRLAGQGDDKHARISLQEFRLSGLKDVTDGLLEALARLAPDLQVLDLSCAVDLRDSALRTFVTWEETHGYDPSLKLTISSREMGLDPGDPTRYYKRQTKLRHINLSSCPRLTDAAAGNLAFAVPSLEFLELASVGPNLKDTGLIRLLRTTPLIRKLDLEDAMDLTDAILEAVTPEPPSDGNPPPPAQPGRDLEHLVLSNASNLTSNAMLALVKACENLRVLEVDGTQVSGLAVKEFVKLSRKRFCNSPDQVGGAELVAVDCRSVPESAIRDLSPITRPRRGRREWEARKLGYEDSASIGVDPDDDAVALYGQDECDEKKVILKTFWSWTNVDTVAAARRKAATSRKKKKEGGASSAGPSKSVIGGLARSRSRALGSNPSVGGDTAESDAVNSARWVSHWSLSRRSASSGSESGSASTIHTPVGDDRGCVIM